MIDEELNPFPRGIPSHSECSFKLADVKYPNKLDWREHGVVAPVRNRAKSMLVGGEVAVHKPDDCRGTDASWVRGYRLPYRLLRHC
eukprot:3299601-Pyramimonas_sp.AAC.2